MVQSSFELNLNQVNFYSFIYPKFTKFLGGLRRRNKCFDGSSPIESKWGVTKKVITIFAWQRINLSAKYRHGIYDLFFIIQFNRFRLDIHAKTGFGSCVNSEEDFGIDANIC